MIYLQFEIRLGQGRLNIIVKCTTQSRLIYLKQRLLDRTSDKIEYESALQKLWEEITIKIKSDQILTLIRKTHFGVSELLQNVHGGGYTHTNLKSRRTDL